MYFKRLYDLRIDNDLTQQQVADYLTCNRQVYARYERGIREIPVSMLVKLDGEKLIEAMPEKFISLTVLKGNGIISAGEAEYSFEERDSIFIPAGEEKYLLRGNAVLIKTTV